MTDIAEQSSGLPLNSAPPSKMFEVFTKTSETASSINLVIRGARCGGCLSKIETAILKMPGVQVARLNLSNGKLRVVWTGALTADAIAETVTSLGYEVSPLLEDERDALQIKDERRLLLALGVSGFAAANVMLLSVSIWSGHSEMSEATRQMFHAVSCLIALPVLLYSGWVFFASAWAALKHGHTNMDVPISLALLLAFSVSVYQTVINGTHAYFDAVVMLLFFLLLGRFLEARLKRKTYAAARALAALKSQAVQRFQSDGTLQTIAAQDVEAGDCLLIAPGERSVVNGRIIDGQSDVDESMVTGETLPRTYQEGMPLYAGATNLSAPLRVEALGAAESSLMAKVEDMLNAGEQRRSAYVKLSDKAVKLYVPLVHTTALLTFIGWVAIGAGWTQAIMIAAATLIITCPCALALATPVTQVVASGKLFRRGIYLKSGDALERLADIDHVVFDKTGTLTLGRPQLVRIEVEGRSLEHGSIEVKRIISQAASMARTSHHPLSRAIAELAGDGKIASGVIETAGKGLSLDHKGRLWRLGSPTWITGTREQNIAGPVLIFERQGDPLVSFYFQDTIEESARRAIQTLNSSSISTEILSGDTDGAVKKIADHLEIGTWSALATPQTKVDRLETLRRQSRYALMVGDGLNDAGALSLAHASVTPGGAVDVSQSASDAVYGRDLQSIPVLLKTSRRAKQVMEQNFAFAALYNVIAVPIAITGHVTPLIAAIAMSASSLIVTLNALRLNLEE